MQIRQTMGWCLIILAAALLFGVGRVGVAPKAAVVLMQAAARHHTALAKSIKATLATYYNIP